MLRVILVEDEFYIRETLKRIIDWEAEGYEIVDEASNGKQAIQKIKEQKLDLVLLDINLLDMDGFGVITQLKKEEEQPRIIIITGYDTFEFAKKAISCGVADYLLKPVMAAELLCAVQKVRGQIIEKMEGQRVFRQLTDDICRLIPLVDAEVLKDKNQLAMEQENNHALIKKVKQFVAANLGNEELNVVYISKKMFLNLSYLSHVFKKETDQGLKDYIFTQRMDYAYDIAMTSDKGIDEIAEMVGYKDTAYFGKCFKKHFGISISHIRKIQNKYKK